jgi:hypothetical protein
VTHARRSPSERGTGLRRSRSVTDDEISVVEAAYDLRGTERGSKRNRHRRYSSI